MCRKDIDLRVSPAYAIEMSQEDLYSMSSNVRRGIVSWSLPVEQDLGHCHI